MCELSSSRSRRGLHWNRQSTEEFARFQEMQCEPPRSTSKSAWPEQMPPCIQPPLRTGRWSP
jgi:hypothetical protein